MERQALEEARAARIKVCGGVRRREARQGAALAHTTAVSQGAERRGQHCKLAPTHIHTHPHPPPPPPHTHDPAGAGGFHGRGAG
jgi:hypothetical protein